MLTQTQKRTAQSILNIFETSEVLGDYGKVTLIPGDTGHLTFGRTQTTLGSGNLHILLDRYCNTSGARFGSKLAPYLPRLESRDLSLDTDGKFHNLLRASADDLYMRETQDIFFDECYWQPAERAAAREGIQSALGVAVVYDGFVHGAWKAMRDRTNAQVGKVETAGEQDWISAYVQIRHDWLAGHRRSDLRPTAYRMEAFRRLIDQSYWGLELPLVVRGREISLTTLNSVPPGCYDSPLPGSRILVAQSPLPRGLDVRLVQLGLSLRGADIKADGIYGKTSERYVKQYQAERSMPVTGIVDLPLLSQLTA